MKETSKTFSGKGFLKINKQVKTKKTIPFLSAILSFSALFFAGGCTYDKAENILQQPLPDTVSFQKNVIPVFTANCSTPGCHSGDVPSADLNLEPANAYQQLIVHKEINTANPASSVLYIEVNSGDMPQGASRLSDNDISLMLKWIQQGAKNN